MTSPSANLFKQTGRLLTLSAALLLTACGEATKVPAHGHTSQSLTADAGQSALLKKGRNRAAICASCHGSQGISVNPLYPSLAGKEAQLLKEALQAYRSGSRVNPLMSPQARNLTDEDITLLSDYFAALPAPKTP